jgi:SAM-dependent methyltransferase
MPVTAGKRAEEISQRGQYAKGGVGRAYWDFRDRVVLRFLAGRRVLDAGCGEGVTLERIVKGLPGVEAEGIDVDPSNVAICRSHGLPVREGSLYDLPFADASFDSCLLLEVIEHLDQPEHALAELSRVTRPGGHVLVLYPVDWAMFMARVACLRFKEAAFDPGHVRQWTARGLGRAMLRAGLRPIATRHLPFIPPLMLHGLVVGRKEA